LGWVGGRTPRAGGRPHVRLSLPPGRGRPSGAYGPGQPPAVTPFTRRLPGSNIGPVRRLCYEKYGGSRTGVVAASEAKGESNSATRVRAGPGSGRRGLLTAAGAPTTHLEPAGGQDRRDPGRRPGIRLGVACLMTVGTASRQNGERSATASRIALRRGADRTSRRQLCCATSALRSASLNPPQMP
jgi:hypothetical protein